MKVGSSVHLKGTRFLLLKEVVESSMLWRVSTYIAQSDLIWSDEPLGNRSALKSSQYCNHFPNSSQIFSKGNVIQCLELLKKEFPQDFLFFPYTWKIPLQRELLHKYLRARNQVIVQCKGRKSYITSKFDETTDCLVQKYIDNPFTINQYRFTIRVYVLIRSLDPLSIYMFREGLITFKHETLNKYSRTPILSNDSVIGNKRTLSALLEFLEEKGHNVEPIEMQIQDFVIKICISLHSQILHESAKARGNAFQLIGIDFMLDTFLNAWFVGIKHSPSFKTSTAVDEFVKKKVILSTLRMFCLKKRKGVQYFQKIYPTLLNCELYDQYLYSVKNNRFRGLQDLSFRTV